MKVYTEYLPHAREQWDKVRLLQSEGLICDDGEFVPSVHYPPITQYSDLSPDELLDSYTLPADGKTDVYVHFPFCIQSCTFCHYPGLVGNQAAEKDRYIRYLKKEMELYLERFQIERLCPRSVLVGGGTPTYLSPAQLEDFLLFFCKKVDLSGCRQFNYDVDPNTLVGEEGLTRLKILREHGVTRLTIGVQSLDDGVLRCMNRAHDAKTAREAIENTKRFGFDLNIEFIFGHPGETLENWAEVIQQAVQLNTDEIQLYRLKVLAYGDKQGHIINRRDAVPDFEQTMLMKQIAIDILNENGWFENLRRVYTKSKKNISHYAYNQCCNLYDQAGFGLTGFSSYRDRFSLNTQHFDRYYAAIDNNTLPISRGVIRSPEQQLRWSVILPLKNMEVKRAAFEKMNGKPLHQIFTQKRKLLRDFGLLLEDERSIRLTGLGSFVADEVAEQFNSVEYLPFERSRYAGGRLNPYLNNTTRDAFGG
ncbi:MAG: radical SAM protein [Oscillospiraceae bacterium]|nr:radical SAM protein [Oscillospiraceae bacterium]